MILPMLIKSGRATGDIEAAIAALWAQIDVFEALLKQREGRFIVNDEVTIADL